MAGLVTAAKLGVKAYRALTTAKKAAKAKTLYRVGRNTAGKAASAMTAAEVASSLKRKKDAAGAQKGGTGTIKKMLEGMDKTGKKRVRDAAQAAIDQSPATIKRTGYPPSAASSTNGKAAPSEVKKEAKKTVKAAKKAVKTATKTVKKAASLKAGTPLGEKNTYTTSGTHAGGRKSSASRKIKHAKSLRDSDYAR